MKKALKIKLAVVTLLVGGVLEASGPFLVSRNELFPSSVVSKVMDGDASPIDDTPTIDESSVEDTSPSGDARTTPYRNVDIGPIDNSGPDRVPLPPFSVPGGKVQLYEILNIKFPDNETVFLLAILDHEHYKSVGKGGVTEHHRYGMRFLLRDKTITYLPRNSRQGPYAKDLLSAFRFIGYKTEIDEDASIPEYEYPKSISGPNSNQELNLIEEVYSPPPKDSYREIFKDPKLGAVTLHRSNPDKFYIFRNDGSALTYDNYRDVTLKTIHWKNGFQGQKHSLYINNAIDRNDVAGSYGGPTSPYSRIASSEELDIEADLVLAGETEDGERLLTFSSSDHPLLKEFFNISTLEFDYLPYRNEIHETYEEFIESIPVLFWIDPFGRAHRYNYVNYLNTMAVEPLIYLYPSTRMDIHVKINPPRGVIAANPDYRNGWLLDVEPSGAIRVKGTPDKVYPHLFWEGGSVANPIPKEGYVVKKGQLHGFLSEKLRLLGLNHKETTDFTDYWIPILSKSPYCFISFLSRSEIDYLYPVTIHPSPGSFIRVMMDYQYLEEPEPVQEPKLEQPPPRKGFVAVEWGGIVR
ncbi:MAG: hypothetical protein JW913_14920 [Chitinispirillaceae bacterium]|nr:hypothetical protein [Chitinispirillaceae bacterium]